MSEGMRRRESDDRRSRRRVLRDLGGAGAAGLAAVAGCLDSGSPGTSSTATGTTAAGSVPVEEPDFSRWTHVTPHDGLGPLVVGPTDPPTPALYVGSPPPDRGDDSGDGPASRLLALDLQSGSAEWEVTLPAPPRAPPVHGGEEPRLYLPTGYDSLHGKGVELQAIDPVAGERAWRFDTEDRRFLYALGTTDDAVFVGRQDDQLGRSGEYVYALDAADGTEQWRTGSGDATDEDGTVRRDTLFLSTRGLLRALDPATGDERWRISSDRGFDGPAFDSRGKRLFVGGDGVIVGLSQSDGSEIWRREVDFTVSRVSRPRAAAGTSVYVADFDGRLHALSPLEGETRWTRRIQDGQLYPSLQRTSSTLFVGGDGVTALDPVSGEEQWAFVPGGEGGVEMHASTTVFALEGRENRLTALDPETGDRRWQFDPDAEVTGLDAAGDAAFVGVEGAVYALDGAPGA